MDAVIHAHNSMNEVTWSHVLAWESLHRDTCCDPALLRFRGRPDDLRWGFGGGICAGRRGRPGVVRRIPRLVNALTRSSFHATAVPWRGSATGLGARCRLTDTIGTLTGAARRSATSSTFTSRMSWQVGTWSRAAHC